LIRILPPTRTLPAVTGRRAVSHLGDGRQVVWEPGRAGAIAVDGEILRDTVPTALQTRFGAASPRAFYEAWTRAECSAKLRGIPILLWLGEFGLAGDPRLQLDTGLVGDAVVTTGRRT
jgi:hypothetical protein